MPAQTPEQCDELSARYLEDYWLQRRQGSEKRTRACSEVELVGGRRDRVGGHALAREDQRAVALMAGVLAPRGAQKADLYEPSRFIRTNERQAAPLT
jgi:hypothetical protein